MYPQEHFMRPQPFPFPVSALPVSGSMGGCDYLSAEKQRPNGFEDPSAKYAGAKALMLNSTIASPKLAELAPCRQQMQCWLDDAE